ncbi:hypothetical protein ACFSUD_05835 [Sulfitobacter aestuarii]|uniref:Excalibur calcium-binding domain-containing protein n=1 Tax=Sulfitobacter aestuarii TaxID=2161676 RepID=A0ABW5U0H9_9RHOB
MITRAFLVLATGAVLSACQPAVPDSGRGVGFDGQFAAEQRQRDQALSGSGSGSIPAPAPVNADPLPPPEEGSPEATAAETARVLAATRPGASNGVGNDPASNSGIAPLQASPANPAPVLDGAGISRENNFDAVSDQRSINDDAARLAANRAQYQVIEPEALPERRDSGPNIVAYALQANHARGTQIYKRIGFNKAAKYNRACGQYSHPDQAQIAFLADGGPERDRKGMDPDGDGFACDWDPGPFRRATQG